MDSEVLKGRLLAVKARTAHDRFGLTLVFMVRGRGGIGKARRFGEGPFSHRCEEVLSVKKVYYLEELIRHSANEEASKT
jgi:hypothetical protein